MTADDLMRLIGRYTEACDDLGAGLFEQTAAETDAKHGKATFLHGEILAEVMRLHAALDQKHAEYEDLKRCSKNNASNLAQKLEGMRHELAMVNNEFGSQNAEWPEAWRRVAEVKERAGRYWRDNETLRAALTVVVRDWTEQFERYGHSAPGWVRQAREALGPNAANNRIAPRAE